MLRRCLFHGLWVAALLWQLGHPGQVHAQHARGGFRPVARPMMTPGFRGGFRPGLPAAPMSRFDPRFRGGMFDPRFDPRFRGGMFDRRFDRFEDRFDPRFRGGVFDPRFDRRFR